MTKALAQPCRAEAGACSCILITHTDGLPHECKCGGKWKGRMYTFGFEVIKYPRWEYDASWSFVQSAGDSSLSD